MTSAAPIITITTRPTTVYSTVTSKLRIQGQASGRGRRKIHLSFIPKISPDDYKVTIVSDTVLSLGLLAGKSWPTSTSVGDGEGTTMYLTSFVNDMKGPQNLLEEPVAVANVINTPTVMHGGDKVIYMTGTTRFNINGTAFRAKAMALTFEPPLVKDVDYILQVRSSTCMQLTLRSNRKWRSDGDPGALKLRRIDTGAGALRIDAKYGGVTVAEVQGDGKLDILGSGFNTSAGLNTLKWGNSLRGKGINYTITSASKSQLSLAAPGSSGASTRRTCRVVYQTHTHELWITGTGFTRGAYSTRVDFDPPLLFGVDYVMMVFNRTRFVSLMDGANPRQTAAIRKLLIRARLRASPELTFQPPLALNSDYKITRAGGPAHAEPPEAQEVALRGGPLYLTALKCGSDAIELAYGQGIVVATVLADPTIEMSERKIYATHTKRLIVQGSGFSLDGTELTLRPTSRASYEVESVEMAEMVLLLKDGKSWAPLGESSSPVSVYVTKVDTGAGEVVMEDDGAVIARVYPDPSGAVCDDSCEWALDGVCDDGSSQGRTWFDDDYGGFYAYDGDYYGYGATTTTTTTTSAPVCEAGTDCTDCGGLDPEAPSGVDCSNACQWANDGYCDDTRTSGLCDLGTDCHDCGPASEGNFTTWDDDGWWDDDENYWDDDYDFENYSARRQAPRRLHQGVVVGIGCVMCAVGSWFAHKFYKGDKLPFELLAPPSAEDELEMAKSAGRAAVPITPDVAYTGK
ncbi:hypothetical protein JL721_3330 [Aureococcus anophagefferens]|nr:hypothetical protein JL721_3330 [Aureococcus anophagefferens]